MPAPLVETVANNLRALMLRTPEYSSPKKLAAKIRTSKSTVERIRAGSVACQIDTLEAIASAFDLQPWQLLVPGLDAGNPPMLRDEDDRLKALYSSLRHAAESIAEYEKTGKDR
jgi:transcriptional regulator with XRE-family HTH domain